MANIFKSAMVDITSTDLTTLLTVPTANPGATPPVPPTTDVIKSILICNDSGSTTLVDLEVVRSSATFEYLKLKVWQLTPQQSYYLSLLFCKSLMC